jgi:hypothetical protein
MLVDVERAAVAVPADRATPYAVFDGFDAGRRASSEKAKDAGPVIRRFEREFECGGRRGAQAA